MTTLAEQDKLFKLLTAFITGRLMDADPDTAVVIIQRLQEDLERMRQMIVLDADAAWDTEANRGNH